MSGIQISDQQKQQFQEEGYMILERVIPAADLENLRSEAQRFVDDIHDRMDQAGTDTLGISHRNSRYFIADTAPRSSKIADFIMGDTMAAVCRATLGDDAFFFLDQYVLKAADRGMKFSWHQDSGYVGHPHPPYLTCWCALDDVNEENGTVYVLPYSQAGTKDLIRHEKEEGTNDMVGYFGDQPGVPAIVSAGSIVVFSSYTLHRSGSNQTNKMRRAFLAQYTREPLCTSDGSRLWHRAERFLEGGQIVWNGRFGEMDGPFAQSA